MMDKVGKVFFALGSQRMCLVCDVLFEWKESRAHSAETCFPVPSTCPPIPYGIVEGEA
jgi:hypothetical protein